MTEQMPENEIPQDIPEKTIEEVKNEKRFLLEKAAHELGFHETSELKRLNQILKEVIQAGLISVEALNLWRDEAEAMVESIKDKELFKKAQIGLLLSKATIYLDADMIDEFYEDIDDAIMYASNLNLDEIVEVLKRV